MPIYEYACKKCDHLFDVLQKMSDEPLTFCPECGEPGLKKLISAPSFRLKGGGWYETDFKTGDKRNLAGDAAKSDGAGKGDKGEKSDKSAKADKGDKKDKADTPAAKPVSSGGAKSASAKD